MMSMWLWALVLCLALVAFAVSIITCAVVLGPKRSVTGATGPSGAKGPSGSTGPKGDQGAQGEPGMEWNGLWSSAVTYDFGRVVAFNGSSFISVVDGNLNNPPNTSPLLWNVVALRGQQGATGATGVRGATGAGVAGSIGPTGERGATGATGDSVTGPIGATGAMSSVTGPTGTNGPQGAQGAMGAPFQTNYVGPVDDSFFGVSGPAAEFCSVAATGAFFVAIVSIDNRVNTGVPTGIGADISGDLLIYTCSSGTWVNLGTFDALPGPTGPTGGQSNVTGPTGTQGQQGPTGVSSFGSTGSTGSTGIAGPAGGFGPTGASITGATGIAGPDGEPGLVNRGAWFSSVTYNTNDAVSHNGSFWLSLVDGNLGIEPGTDPLSWQLLARAGATGPAGSNSSIPLMVLMSDGNPSNNSFIGQGFTTNIEEEVMILMPRQAVLQRLSVALRNGPGGTDTRTFTVRVNFVNTPLTLTMSGSTITAFNLVDTVAVNFGDRISVLHQSAGGPINSDAVVAFEYA